MAKRGAEKAFKALAITPAPLKLDLGCGPSKRPGFHGVDIRDIPGVDTVHDLRVSPWPWADGTVEHVHASHTLEHLTNPERIVFFNELYRILKIGGTAEVISPHWSNACAYGDPTHVWPPVSEWAGLYLNKEWRLGDGTPAKPPNAPHVGYTCDFDFMNGFSFDPRIQAWNQERQMFGLTHHLNSARDIHINLTKNR
jgi:hypothetical protein